MVSILPAGHDKAKGFQEMFNACPFLAEGGPLLKAVKAYNRSILADNNGDLQASKGKMDLFTERYLQTVTKVGKVGYS